jgi:hypothetical protein
MMTIHICYSGFIPTMPMAQSKRKLNAATALFIAVGALTGAIATGGAVTASFAQTQGQDGGGGGSSEQQVRIVRQGTLTSEPVPIPGVGGERATILPLREDGSIYSGVLTFTASEPINVVVLNVQNLNETEQAILNATDDEEGGQFGQLLTAALDNQTRLVLTAVAPDYGASPIPSASLAFTGNALWLHNPEDQPFVANYAVSAQTSAPEIMNDISNATLAVAEDEDAADEEGAAAAAAADEEGAADADADEEGAADADADADEEGAADAGTNATDTA